jgi:hypothetical protein
MTALPIDLSTLHETRALLEPLLAQHLRDQALLAGLLGAVCGVLRELAADPATPRPLTVEVTASDALVEVRIPHGPVVDAWVCPL